MFRAEIKAKIEQELTRGADARAAGLEGRARVCARRAAGVVVREFLALKGISLSGLSSIELLGLILEMPDIPVEVRSAAQRLLIRVNEDFTLPSDIDLLNDVRWLAQALERIASVR